MMCHQRVKTLATLQTIRKEHQPRRHGESGGRIRFPRESVLTLKRSSSSTHSLDQLVQTLGLDLPSISVLSVPPW